MSDFKQKPIKEIQLNPPQAAAVVAQKKAKKKKIFMKMGRGLGKSTIQGYFIKEAAVQMPGSTGLLVGPSYKQLKSVLLKSIKNGLAMFGVYQDIDYVVGQRGKGFRVPVDSPENWHDVIHFRWGSILQMISMDMADAGRGFNAHYVIGDECTLFDQSRYEINVAAANRAQNIIYNNATMLNAEILTSSAPMTKKGRWFSKLEQVCADPKNQATHAYIQASTHWNLHNLPPNYLRDARQRAVSELHYAAEYLNEDPPAVANAFYSNFDEDHHTYDRKFNIDYLGKIEEYEAIAHDNCRQDADLIPNAPISISIDPGSNNNFLTVWQYVSELHEERTLKEFFVSKPKDYIDLIKEFDSYYEFHKNSNKTLFLHHDAQAYKEKDKTGVVISANIEQCLRSLGWRVVNLTPRTNNPLHSLKYQLMNEILKERSRQLPKWRINRNNCPNLIISMSNAETKVKEYTDFGKDKRSELDANILPQHATHLSDTADYYLYWKYYERLMNNHSTFTMPLT